MNLYLLIQNEITEYGQFDTVLVAANSEGGVRAMWDTWDNFFGEWSENDDAHVVMIGKAVDGVLAGAILSGIDGSSENV